MVRLLTFNIEYGAQAYPLERAVAVVREARADVAAIAEAVTDGGVDTAARLAAALGWHHLAFPANSSAVISRWPLRAVPGAALVSPPGGAPEFYVVSAHFDDYPYQPFQAEGTPYCYDACQRDLKSAPPVALARAAEKARGEQVAAVAALARRLAGKAPVAILGDFNEPSHLDWTPRAVQSGLAPRAVEFPASRRLYAAGFVDAYRAAHPDEVAAPGHTWPARDPGYPGRADRIDFVYVRAGDRVLGCEPLALSPSDHRAVVAEVEFARSGGGGRRPRGGSLGFVGGALGGSLLPAVLLAALVLLVVLVAVAIARAGRGAGFRPATLCAALYS